MAEIDIFSPQTTKPVRGLEGKSFFIYGGNSTGKTAQAIRMSKPYIIATETGLNATVNVNYNRYTSWRQILKTVKQFTSPATVERAREMYDTIVIDEVYASALLCQDYVIATYGQGALTLGDSQGNVNLYQAYEKEYFKTINQLLSCDYTVVFIGHAQENKDGKIVPKGDKRCIDPIRDFVDYVIYVQSNGVDENGKVIPSSAYLAETKEFFARSRFDSTPSCLPVWSVEALTEAVSNDVDYLCNKFDVNSISYAEQKAQDATKTLDYEELQDQLQQVGQLFAKANAMDVLTEIVEDTLGVGKKVSQCTKKQVEAMAIILDNLRNKAEELGLTKAA